MKTAAGAESMDEEVFDRDIETRQRLISSNTKIVQVVIAEQLKVTEQLNENQDKKLWLLMDCLLKYQPRIWSHLMKWKKLKEIKPKIDVPTRTQAPTPANQQKSQRYIQKERTEYTELNQVYSSS